MALGALELGEARAGPGVAVRDQARLGPLWMLAWLLRL